MRNQKIIWILRKENMLKLVGWRYSNASGKLIPLTTYVRKGGGAGGSLGTQWLRLQPPPCRGPRLNSQKELSYMSQPRDAGTEDLPRYQRKMSPHATTKAGQRKKQNTTNTEKRKLLKSTPQASTWKNCRKKSKLKPQQREGKQR